MWTIALDTTTRSGSVALARDERVIDEFQSDAALSHAERLPSDLRVVLDRAGVTLGDVDVFAVATGPGSFTGLRIGIATMQGLAFAHDKPLIGISGLEALAEVARPRSPRIATWVDAWRGEVYAALFEEGREVIPPLVDTPESVLKAIWGRESFNEDTSRASGRPGEASSLNDSRPHYIFVGGGADTYRDLIVTTTAGWGRLADPITPSLAGTIATMAARLAAAGHRPKPHAVRPLYVRRPDAELARSRSRGVITGP